MDDATIERLRIGMKIYGRCIQNRGGIVDSAIRAENILTDILAWCLYPVAGNVFDETGNQLDENGIIVKSLILNKIDFRNKINLLQDLVSMKFPDEFNQNRQLMSDIVKLLNKVREFRNLLAHSPSDDSEEALELDIADEHSFRIIRYRKGKAHKYVVSGSIIERELSNIHKSFYKLLQLWAILKHDSEDARACDLLADLPADRWHDVLVAWGLSED